MPEASVAESVTLAAVPERVGLARSFVARVLGESHAHVDLALLLASELVTNSVRHSGSAVPGGVVTVAAGGEAVGVEVTDRMGDGVPVLPPAAPAGDEAEGHRGLWLVDALSAGWGYQRGGGFATTWFELGPGANFAWTWRGSLRHAAVASRLRGGQPRPGRPALSTPKRQGSRFFGNP